MLICLIVKIGDIVEIMKEYGIYLKDTFLNLLNNDFYYLIIFAVALLVSSVLCGIIAKSILTDMRFKVSGIIYVPFINILYITSKAIHSLLAIVITLEVLLLIPIPHPSKGVWMIDSIVPGNFKTVLFMVLMLEIICVLLYLIIQYIIYDHELKIVR